MVVDDKALVREMKEAFKGWGYTVMLTSNDRWVIGSRDNWTVAIDGQNNVPNEVLALIVMHMGELPKQQQCYRIYKAEKSICIQKEVYRVAFEDFENMEDSSSLNDEVVRKTALVYGRCRVWQQIEDKKVLLINQRFEDLMEIGADSVVCTVGQQIHLKGEISCVYISRVRGGANEELLEHLAKVSWT